MYGASGTLYRSVSEKVLLRYCLRYVHLQGPGFHITYGNAVTMLSRITSYSISFHPAMQRSTRTSPTRERRSPFSRISTSSVLLSAIPPPSTKCVSRTKYNRISDTFSKFDTSLYILYDFRSCTRFADFSIVILNSRRSSAFLIVSEVVPIRRTLFLSRNPFSSSSIARSVLPVHPV